MYYESNDNTLAHYGVLGMKWGVRKAEKKGETYKYKSRSTKRYERKAARATGDKAKLYKQRAKRSAEHDRNMQKIAEKQSGGKTAVKYLLAGPLNATGYDRVKAAGGSRGEGVANHILAGYLGGYAAKSLYIRQDEQWVKNAAADYNELKSSAKRTIGR